MTPIANDLGPLTIEDVVMLAFGLDTHRGWDLSHDYPPIPCRQFDWSATHPDYDGADDANDNRIVHGPTRDAVIAEIDAWHDEQEEF